jgi:alpha-L-fucosidase 2
MKRETKELYDIDGIKIPCITNGTGQELSYLPCRLWQHGAAWLCQLYWWGYLYTLDNDFLRRQAYPLMREVAKFYRAYATLGPDDKYHVFPSTPPEQSPWWSTDPAIDIALIRVHLASTLQASDLLDLDEDLRQGWRELLDNLAEIPNNGDVFLDHRHATPDLKLAHTAMMCCTWTAGLIGISSPPEQKAMAMRTLELVIANSGRQVENYPFPNMHTWNDDCCWPNLVGYAARLGLAEKAKRHLYDYGIFQHLKPNGIFAFDCPVTDEHRELIWGMPDSNHAMTAVVSEMLIQSYDGIIRLCPATPDDWDAEFQGFLTVGAFEVDASIRRGRVASLSLLSLKGNLCRLANPWPGQAIQIRSGAKPVPIQIRGEVIEFATQPNAIYESARPDAGAEPGGASHNERDLGPLCYTGPKFFGDVPPKKRINVWLGMPKN